MTHRNRNILIAVLVLVALLLALLLFLRSRGVVLQPNPTVTPGEEDQTTPVIPSPSPEAAAEREQVSDAQTTAKIFAERYGSYSSESNFANIRDVLPLTTPQYRSELEVYIASTPAPTGVYTVTTRLVSVKVDEMNEAEGTATLILSTQRTESKDNLQNVTTRYQDITIELERQGDTWLVSDATWK